MAARVRPSTGRKSDRLWRDQLMMRAKETDSELMKTVKDAKAPALTKLAARTYMQALEGCTTSMKEIANRIDGKVPEEVVVAGGGENGEHVFRWVVVRAKDGKPIDEVPEGAA